MAERSIIKDSDFLQFLLALVLVLGFLAFIFKFAGDKNDLVEKVIIGFIAWIGTIVGFYFGQRPVKEMMTRTQEMAGEVEKRKDIIKNSNLDLEDALEAYKEIQVKFEKLKEQVGELLTQEVE